MFKDIENSVKSNMEYSKKSLELMSKLRRDFKEFNKYHDFLQGYKLVKSQAFRQSSKQNQNKVFQSIEHRRWPILFQAEWAMPESSEIEATYPKRQYQILNNAYNGRHTRYRHNKGIHELLQDARKEYKRYRIHNRLEIIAK